MNSKIDVFSDTGIIGEAPVWEQIRSLVQQVAATDISVLITGESGTGKELIAKAIHNSSRRKGARLVTVNCGAIPEGIFESEIFGHEKGAFTGADRQRQGMFEQADGGTILLDEIGEMPLFMQVKLLRVLESGSFMRVGGTRPLEVDVRVLAATNRDLAEMVQSGRFRQDLYYRLKAINILLPPLRERPEDIKPLVYHFASVFCRKNGLDCPDIGEEALQVLQEHYWEGNVRELRNFVESLVLLLRGDRITAADVRQSLQRETGAMSNLPVLLRPEERSRHDDLLTQMFFYIQRELVELKEMVSELKVGQQEPEMAASREVSQKTVEDMEREHIREILEQYNWNRKQAALALGIGERTIYRKIRKYGL
ncbi:MAG: sigma-54-dependent Fis family transcriptional regulator [Candidatus Delongbacteria bacterium]|nr:sigma-54-dependent Fis family transcriptional regulator [Candidatus Delongbacteria bacterium]